jgi:hypothetical protein
MRFSGAVSPSSDMIFATVNGAADAGGSGDLGSISGGNGVALFSRRTDSLANGADGRLALALGTKTPWTSGELDDIADYVAAEFLFSGGGA